MKKNLTLAIEESTLDQARLGMGGFTPEIGLRFIHAYRQSACKVTGLAREQAVKAR